MSPRWWQLVLEAVLATAECGIGVSFLVSGIYQLVRLLK